MNARDKILTTVTTALLCSAPLTAANAQDMRQLYRTQGPAPIVEEDYSRVNIVPRVIERRVLVQPNVTIDQTALPKRSNYSKRLGDMLEQLSFAYERGWLSARQYADLKSWEASVAMEELVLRQKGDGIVPRADVEQLERHLNGLAYTINRQISEGSRVANAEEFSP